MAKAAKNGEVANAMDYAEHERTYGAFLKMFKWGTAFCVALMIAMAAGFFAGFGLFGGTVVFAILCIIAYFFI